MEDSCLSAATLRVQLPNLTLDALVISRYAPDTALTDGTRYWRVSAVDNAGNQGSFSQYSYPTIEAPVTATVALTLASHPAR